MVKDDQILIQLNNIKEATNSDVLAFALIDSGKRKLSWYHVIGAQCARTFKIKQSVTAGLTGQAIRTGKPQTISIQSSEERFCYGEAIMMTEQLSQIYVWPVMYQQLSYQGVIIVGNKSIKIFEQKQLEIATKHINEIEQQINVYSLPI